MCDCGISNPVFPLPGRSPSLSKQENSGDTYEVQRFWTQNLKYCDNPKRHIFGTCSWCRGKHIALGGVDPKDFLQPPRQENPLVYGHF